MNIIFKYRVFLFLVVVLSSVFVFRYSAIHYSLPDGSVFGHTRSYFQDEEAVVADTARLIMAVKSNPLNIFDPGPTVYPIFSDLLSFFPLGISYFTKYRHVDISQAFHASPQAQAVFYSLIAYSGRLISFVAAFFSILLFYSIGLRLGVHRRIMFFLAFVYAWMPVDILMSVEAKSNSLMNLLLLVLYLCILWLETNRHKYLLWASFFVGMATGTRLNGVLGGVMIAASLLFYYQKNVFVFFQSRRNWWIFACPVLGLLFSSPNFVFHPGYIARMWSRSGSGRLIYSLQVGWYDIIESVRMISGGWIWGFLFVAVFIFSLWILFKTADPKQKILAIWFIFYFLIFTQTAAPIIRYAYPLLPLWLLLFALVLRIIWNKKVFWMKMATVVVLSVWGVYILLFGVAYIKLLSEPTLFSEANKYVEKNIPTGSTVGTYYNEAFYDRVPIDYQKYQIFSCRDLEEGKYNTEDFNFRPDFIVTQESGDICLDKVFHYQQFYHKTASFSKDVRIGLFLFRPGGSGAYVPATVAIYEKK